MIKVPYTPERWVILRIDLSEPEETMYRILGGWYGGYLGCDSWRLSSPIVSYEFNEEDKLHVFKNESGSEYECHANCFRMSGLMSSVYARLEETEGVKVTILEFEEFQKEFK